jgi:hypothetical protein
MYPSKTAREIDILLRTSRELDVIGDVTATLDSPSELLAWATILTRPDIVAWHSKDSGRRYLQVTAHHRGAPVRGRVTAVLPCDQHPEFWDALGLAALEPNSPRHLALGALAEAWAVMPITPPHSAGPEAPPGAEASAEPRS